MADSIGAHLETTVRVYMTPEDLRMIAERMEKVWQNGNGLPGTSLDVYTWAGQGVNVHFVVDQDRAKRAPR